MTEVQFKDTYGHIHFVAKGHANYSEAGTDIVCASVSILIQSLIRECQKEEQEGTIEIVYMSVEDGMVDFIVYDPNKRLKKAYSLVITGLEMISESYPENVSIYRAR